MASVLYIGGTGQISLPCVEQARCHRSAHATDAYKPKQLVLHQPVPSWTATLLASGLCRTDDFRLKVDFAGCSTRFHHISAPVTKSAAGASPNAAQTALSVVSHRTRQPGIRRAKENRLPKEPVTEPQCPGSGSHKRREYRSHKVEAQRTISQS